MTQPAIGPILMSTIFSKNAQESIHVWCKHFYQSVHSESVITEAQADRLGAHRLAGNTSTWLQNSTGEVWLNIIQSDDESQHVPFVHHGWLSLEIAVSDVDQLHEELKDTELAIIGLPATLDVSDDIRAMQAVGPDGEVLYLSEVKAPIPPFDIPMARSMVDRTFIAVGTVPDRNAAAAIYEQFDKVKSYSFDTRITVINRALGYDIERKHPVAAVQLGGSCMVELDQVDDISNAQAELSRPTNGIAMISFAVETLPDNRPQYQIDSGPYQGDQACLIRGSAGEFMELIQQNQTR